MRRRVASTREDLRCASAGLAAGERWRLAGWWGRQTTLLRGTNR